MKKFLSLIIITATLMLSLCACGDDTVTMVMPISADPMCIDPQVVETEAGNIIVANCYEGLVRLDENYKIIPGVAVKWDISADGLEYTFTLRNDSVWQMLEKAHKDILPENFNNKVTAHDFEFALRRALDPNTRCTDAEKFLCIKNAAAVNDGSASPTALGVKAANDTTLTISLDRADPDLLRKLTLPTAMPCNRAFFELTHAKYGLDLSYTLCNGPFYLSRWAADNTLVMRKAEGYKGEIKTKVDAVYFSVNGDRESVISKFRQHTYDCVYLGSTGKKELADIKNISYLESVDTVSGLCFNCDENALYNINLRKALLCISKISELDLPDNACGRASGIIPDCCRFADGSYRKTAGRIKYPAYNETLAKELWAKGLKESELENPEIKIICTREMSRQMQMIIQDWQRVLGTSIIAKVETLSDDEFNKAIKNGTYQIAAGSISASSSTAVDTLKLFKSEDKGNIFNYASEDYDKLVDEITANAAGDNILNGCKTAEQMLIAEAVFCPLFTYSKSIAVSNDDTGLFALPVFESIIFINGGKK